MNPAKLRHTIAIYHNVKTTNERNKTVNKEELLKITKAEIIPQTGKMQNAQANTILTNVTHKIIVRYPSNKMLSTDMFIMFQGKRFDIIYILNPYFKNETLEVFVEEVIT